MGSEAGYLLLALGEGGYLPYKFSSRDFGAKIQKVKIIALHYVAETFFWVKARFYPALVRSDREGGGRRLLAVASVGATCKATAVYILVFRTCTVCIRVSCLPHLPLDMTASFLIAIR